ncbi:MAG TPA: BadF/BadG/BcrA/BcrD ATPase family protein [Pyrinomonadaceae bacterium]
MAAKPTKRGKRSAFPQYFLGVDGGGTKTHVALMNEAREVVGEGTAGPSNPLRVGVETAVSNIVKATDQAMDEAEILRIDIAGATLGLAGVRRADIKKSVKTSFTDQIRIRKTTVITDAEIALFATTLGKPGIVVIAGTGSVCLGKNEKGKMAIAGGWGPLAGDEGGGVGIAQTALHAVAKASDGRGIATTLSDRASEYFRASGPENLIVAIYSPQVDNTRIAGFARCVVEAAQDGDAVATTILQEAGSELGLAACAVIDKLGLRRQKVPIGCVGSVFKAGEILTDPMIDTVHTIAPKAFLTEPEMPPAHAAALMALLNGSTANNGRGQIRER